MGPWLEVLNQPLYGWLESILRVEASPPPLVVVWRCSGGIASQQPGNWRGEEC
jgi:hypothetical protein